MKTITIDEAAYRILCEARRYPEESFSDIIKRGSWEKRPMTCGEALVRMSAVKEVMSDEALDYLDAIKNDTMPSVSKWDL